MRNRIPLCILIILLLPVSLDARTQERTRDSNLLFPSQPESEFRNQPYARDLYNKMIETMQSAETLYYESECWFEHRELASPERESHTLKKICKVWLKKPSYARLEVLDARTGKLMATLVSDGDYFWMFWPGGLWRSGDERWRDVYIRQPAEGYSIKWDAGLGLGLNGRIVIDPSVFHGSVDEPYYLSQKYEVKKISQYYMDGARRAGTEEVGDEECEIIEVSYLNSRVSKYLWLSKVDHLPRKLKEVDRRWPKRDVDWSVHEIWTNIRLNVDIPTEKFVWKPPQGWRRVTQAALHPTMTPLTESINLSGKWEYAFSDNTSWIAMVYDDVKWETAEVPYILPSLETGKYLWFRKRFFVSEHCEGQKYFLDLGIFSVPVRAYFNGDLVAEAESDSSLVSTIPLDVMFGGDNVIDLRVEISEDADMIHWVGEPALKGASGWIDVSYFEEEDFTVKHYLKYVPRSYTPDRAFPLVIVMPGWPGGGRYGFMVAGLGESAESRGYIIVCPEALQKEYYYQWIGPVQREVFSILSQMKENYNIDAKRIYIMGHSNGGFAAYYIGFRHSELFAAIVPCSGGIGGNPEMLPRMARAAKKFVPVLIAHGAKDTPIPISRARYMLHELKKIGYQCEMLTYPELGHGVIMEAREKIFDFFDKHAKQHVPEAWEALKYKRLEKLPDRQKQLVRSVIKEYVEGCNKGDIERVMACFSKEYSADGMEYLDVRNKTNRFFSDSSLIQAEVKDVKIMPNADSMT